MYRLTILESLVLKYTMNFAESFLRMDKVDLGLADISHSSALTENDFPLSPQHSPQLGGEDQEVSSGSDISPPSTEKFISNVVDFKEEHVATRKSINAVLHLEENFMQEMSSDEEPLHTNSKSNSPPTEDQRTQGLNSAVPSLIRLAADSHSYQLPPVIV